MEAVPKLPLISFELKTSPESTHFGPKLKQYIAEVYREDPDSYNNEMHHLEGLRSAAVRPLIDSAGLNAMIRYFCQLRAMQSRFPMAKGQPAACTFVWRDIYANMNCPLPDIRFEMACILYNIGALLTQLAASEPRTSPESLKAACTHYQNAAWAFLYLREHYPQPPGTDVSTDIMRLLQEICFAQAQECILDKSIQDTKKPSVVGAVATQVMFFYRNALALLGTSTGTDNIHKIIGTKLYNYWYRYLSFKLSYIGCIVCLYQGIHTEEQQKMGERVAFYQLSVEKLNDARKLAKYIEPVQITQEALTFTNDVVEGKRKAAKNENEFIYHEEVPDKDLLVDLKPVCLVKALPINLNDPEVSGPDVFSRLVPIGAHEASSVYSEEKAKLLRQVVGMAESKNTEILEFMSSLQLDQLEVLDSDQKIPQEIVDRCAAMNAKTEIIQTLVDSMNSLAEIISDVEHSLAEIKALIQEETLKEKEYQKVMGPRPPSIVQTELSREFHKYQEAHSRTNESNQVLHKAMTLHIANLRLLAQPLDVLQSKVPSIDNIEGLDRETMMEMRRVVGKAREMQSQRESLIQQLRDDITSDDITSVLLSRASEPAEAIFKQELEKHTPKVKIIEQNLAAQENIINRLTSLYASYGESRRLLSDVLRKREGLINALITSYDSYEELLAKSQKGLEFYKKLSLNVTQLLTRLRSTCQVQEEERAQLLSKHTTKAPTPVPPTSVGVKVTDLSSVPPAPSPGGGSLKLKDYLPYMKNRSLARSVTPQAQMEPLPTDAYYPETIYPTSVRPAPLGSEATDLTQMKLTDGLGMPPMQTPYSRYGTPYSASESDPYAVPPNYAYPATSKPFDKPEDASYGYSNSYTPSQHSSQMSDPQYSHPYYSATQNSTTLVTDSQNTLHNNSQMNVGVNQFGYTDPYAVHANQMGTIPEAVSSPSLYNPSQYGNPADLSSSFAQMQVQPKSEPQNLGGEYAKTYYSVQYPQASTSNMATYSSTMPGSSTSVVPSQVPSEYTVHNSYDPTSQQQIGVTQNVSPYGIPGQVNPVSNAYSMPEQAYSYPGTTYDAVTQGYTIYTSTDSGIALTTSASNVVPIPASVPQEYAGIPEKDRNYVNPAALAQLDAMDQPIKSHVTGEALSTNINFPIYQNYDQTTVNYVNPAEQSQMPSYQNQTDQNVQSNQTNVFSNDPSSINYAYTYQNHPGYTFNSVTGNYDYNYGSQNSFTNFGIPGQTNLEIASISHNQIANPQGVYTSAGNYETVQSPSENPQFVQQSQPEINSQNYYNTPYGYVTTNTQSNEVVRDTPSVSTNYGANVNQSTYMQSGTGPQDTSVTFISSNQVTTPKENVIEPPNFQQNIEVNHTNNDQNSDSHSSVVPPSSQDVTETESVESAKTEQNEPSAIDLLSEIDFSVEYKPLTPEIKVPPISESAIKRLSMPPKQEPAPKLVVKEEVIERPAKVDLFSDPSLLNNFTQQVKNLQKLTDSLTNKVGGLTVLDSKWKLFQEVQAKENMTRTKKIATKHSHGNIVTEVVPFDDSRLTLKSDPYAYINASYYKQLAPWCIPVVISSNPSKIEYEIFWKAVLENKISCVVCLLSEIEMQGKFYWPTAKGQPLSFKGDLSVTLDDVSCTVHWTERKLTVASGTTALNVNHYQINVFPSKIVCSPLVLLSDKILSQTYDNRLSNQLTGALIQCSSGAGRSSVIALLIMAMCQVRAGQIDLCDMLDAACISLYKHRTNVLEDTKYLADAYRTVLFYVQGVLCSGTTMFNGEAVTFPNTPYLPASPPATSPAPSGHKHKYSRESFEEMKQAPGLKSGDMKDPLNFLDPLWSLKKK